MALPKTFTGGERLFADDLNDNFEDLDTRLVAAESDIDTNASDLANASNLTSGAVPSARLTSVPAGSLTGDVAEARLPYVRGTVSTSDDDGVTVTFPGGSFSTTPTILLGASALGPRLLSFRAATASSFILDSYQLDGNRNDIVANWLAVGT
jgi:hypothetical protein